MSNVISITAVRAERVKQALSIHSRIGGTTIIETRSGTIVAEKVTCRDRFAEVLNGLGDYFIVDYADIRSFRPAAVAQTSVVNASGEFVPAHNVVTATSVAILPFARRARRR